MELFGLGYVCNFFFFSFFANIMTTQTCNLLFVAKKKSIVIDPRKEFNYRVLISFMLNTEPIRDSTTQTLALDKEWFYSTQPSFTQTKSTIHLLKDPFAIKNNDTVVSIDYLRQNLESVLKVNHIHQFVESDALEPKEKDMLRLAIEHGFQKFVKLWYYLRYWFHRKDGRIDNALFHTFFQFIDRTSMEHHKWWRVVKMIHLSYYKIFVLFFFYE